MLHYFSDVKYKYEAVLAEAFRLTVASLLHDKEPPVKVIQNFSKRKCENRWSTISLRWRPRSRCR